MSKLVTDAVAQALRPYSKTGKLVRKAVEDAHEVPRLDLPSYGQTIAAIQRTQIDSRVSELVDEHLAADMDGLLKLAPKKFRLATIAEEMLAQNDEDEWG